MDITKLNRKSKCIFAIKLAERASSYVIEKASPDLDQCSSYLDKSEIPGLIHKAIQIGWNWIDTQEGEDVGTTLYIFVDNEENGFVSFQYEEEDEKKISAWNCIIDAIMYVSKAAYEKEGEIYFPQPYELVDDDLFIHMTDSLILCDHAEREYIEKIYQECILKS